MFQMFQRRVLVTMIDDANGDLIGRSMIALTDLPESFLEYTVLEIDQTSWAVETADPPFKREFAKSKKLTVRLNPIERMAARDLLFTMPTIVDDLPGSGGSMADGREAVLLQDDWRQIEFISNQLAAEILQEIRDIEVIRSQARVDIGYREIHVRERIPDPLQGTAIKLAVLEERFGPFFSALRFDDHGRRISSGFRYDLGGNWMLYGTATEDRPTILAAAPYETVYGAPPPNSIESLNALCREHDLCLVDWCRCIKAEFGSAQFSDIFAPTQE